MKINMQCGKYWALQCGMYKHHTPEKASHGLSVNEATRGRGWLRHVGGDLPTQKFSGCSDKRKPCLNVDSDQGLNLKSALVGAQMRIVHHVQKTR